MKSKERPVFVSDHDGTLTNADLEALHYDEIVLDYLAKSLAIKEDELALMMAEAKAVIKSQPGLIGWVKNGFIVAPASADHYIFNTVATEMVLEKLRSEFLTKSASLPERENQAVFISKFFQTTSTQLGSLGDFYREGVEDYIQKLTAAGEFVIVTNSSPDTVFKKLRGLLGDRAAGLKVVGNAKKYAVDPDWVGVVPQGVVDLPGFPRGVYLQRRVYYEALLKLAEGDISRIAVYGDIPELDTLMVDYLGCRTALIEGGTTFPWERAYYQNGEERRFASQKLDEISLWLTGN